METLIQTVLIFWVLKEQVLTHTAFPSFPQSSFLLFFLFPSGRAPENFKSFVAKTTHRAGGVEPQRSGKRGGGGGGEGDQAGCGFIPHLKYL